jgi:hypothetical protein
MDSVLCLAGYLSGMGVICRGDAGMTVFRVHYLEYGILQTADIETDSPDKAREFIQPKGSEKQVKIIKVKVVKE